MTIRQKFVAFFVTLVIAAGIGAIAATPAFAVPPTGAVNIRPDGTSKCMDVTGVSYDNGAPIQLYDCLGGGQYNQVFYLVQKPGNPWYVQIKASHSFKCLDVAWASQDPGASLIQWECNGQDNQYFYMYPLYPGNRWYIQPTHSWQYVTYQGLWNGASVFQWPTGGGPVWQII